MCFGGSISKFCYRRRPKTPIDARPKRHPSETDAKVDHLSTQFRARIRRKDEEIGKRRTEPKEKHASRRTSSNGRNGRKPKSTRISPLIPMELGIISWPEFRQSLLPAGPRPSRKNLNPNFAHFPPARITPRKKKDMTPDLGPAGAKSVTMDSFSSHPPAAHWARFFFYRTGKTLRPLPDGGLFQPGKLRNPLQVVRQVTPDGVAKSGQNGRYPLGRQVTSAGLGGSPCGPGTRNPPCAPWTLHLWAVIQWGKHGLLNFESRGRP